MFSNSLTEQRTDHTRIVIHCHSELVLSEAKDLAKNLSSTIEWLEKQILRFAQDDIWYWVLGEGFPLLPGEIVNECLF